MTSSAKRSASSLSGCAWVSGLGLALLSVGGCGSSSDSAGARPTAVVALVSSQVSTIVTVTWATAVPSIGYVEYGVTPEVGFTTPMEALPSTSHSQTLLGLTADTDFYYRVITWADGNAAAGDMAVVRTGPLPATLPGFTVQVGEFDRFVALPVSGAPPAVTIVGSEGRVLWYHLDNRGLELYRARFSADGMAVLYSAASPAAALDTPGAIIRVGFDGTETVMATLPSLVGDFVERSDGTVAAVVAEVRDVGGVATRGDSIVEIGAGGVQTVVWSAWDCFDPALHPAVVPEEGWAVVDTLQLDATNEAYYVGIRSLGSIARVNRATRACDWVFGQTGATVAYADGAAAIAGQRQAEVVPEGVNTRVTLLDTNADGTLRVAEYRFAPPAGPAALGWSQSGPAAEAGPRHLGQPSRLSNSRVLVNWATEGSLQLIDSTGVVTWAVSAPEGSWFGLHALTEALYTSP